jgi:hypothetical protein
MKARAKKTITRRSKNSNKARVRGAKIKPWGSIKPEYEFELAPQEEVEVVFTDDPNTNLLVNYLTDLMKRVDQDPSKEQIQKFIDLFDRLDHFEKEMRAEGLEGIQPPLNEPDLDVVQVLCWLERVSDNL